MSILKTNSLLASTLSFTNIDNRKVVDSSREKSKKLAKSIKLNFIKAIYRAKKSSFLTPNIEQAFTKLS